MVPPDLLCPDCGEVEGAPFHPGDACHCGGLFVEVGVDVLKALLPFAPTKPVEMFRIWKVDKGISVGLGISSSLREVEIIHAFLPVFAEGEDTTLKLRKVDRDYREIGVEVTMHIPAANPTLAAARALEKSINSLTAGKQEIQSLGGSLERHPR